MRRRPESLTKSWWVACPIDIVCNFYSTNHSSESASFNELIINELTFGQPIVRQISPLSLSLCLSISRARSACLSLALYVCVCRRSSRERRDTIGERKRETDCECMFMPLHQVPYLFLVLTFACVWKSRNICPCVHITFFLFFILRVLIKE